MTAIDKVLTVDEMKRLAHRRVPKMFFEYADSGSYTEGTYRENESDFAKIKLNQKVAVNLEGRNLKVTMLGKEIAMPVAIAPAATGGMQVADGEIKAAKEGKLPWIVGTTANVIDPQAAFIKTGTQASMPQKAGISGTTFRFMEASALLGGDAAQSRLAMMGALQAIDAHTFYEIANAAAGFGLGYNPNMPYANLLPEPILRALAKKSGSTLEELNGAARSSDVPTVVQTPK